MKSSFTISAIALACLMVTGCNTISGAGEDIEAGGEVITDTAETVKEDIED